jgi:hypothetical protein
MFRLFRKSSHAPGKQNKSFLEMVSYAIKNMKLTLPITNAIKSDFDAMIDNCVADGAGEAIKFRDWDFIVNKYYPGNMGIPQAIVGGDPEIIPIPVKIKCTHCQRIITDDDSEGCCSHCGAPIEYPQESEALKRLLLNTGRALDEFNQPKPSHELPPVRCFYG